MPYISQSRRDALGTGNVVPATAGELNYMLTRQCLAYMSGQDLSYQTINDVMGALQGATLEMYRRVAVPYEDYKLELNGDVYK
jgi:hypothetical protein